MRKIQKNIWFCPFLAFTYLFSFLTQLYDKKSDDNRISLLPKLWNGPTQQEDPPESNALKIYLCDNCEAELYTEEAYAVSDKRYIN